MHYNKTTKMVGTVMKILEKLNQQELANTECLIIKICFKFLFKTGGRL